MKRCSKTKKILSCVAGNENFMDDQHDWFQSLRDEVVFGLFDQSLNDHPVGDCAEEVLHRLREEDQEVPDEVVGVLAQLELQTGVSNDIA